MRPISSDSKLHAGIFPWSQDLFIPSPFQLPGEHTDLAAVSDADNLIVHIAISVLPGTHFFHLSRVEHTWVKCLAQGHTIVTEVVHAPTTIPSRATCSANSINVPVAHYRSLPCLNGSEIHSGWSLPDCFASTVVLLRPNSKSERRHRHFTWSCEP